MNISELLAPSELHQPGPMVWSPDRIYVTDHDLKKARFCHDHPEYVFGSPAGHLIPGTMILLGSLYSLWVVFSRYFKSIAPGSKYKFCGLPGRMPMPWCPRTPLAVLLLAALILHCLGTLIIPVLHRNGVPLSAVRARIIWFFTANVHLPMLSIFMLGAIFDIMEPKRRFSVPRNTSSVLYAMAFFFLTATAFHHWLSPKCEYGARLHMAFIFFPSLMTTLWRLIQISKPSSFFLALGANFWSSLVGLGFLAVGFLGFPVAPGDHQWLDPAHPDEKIEKVHYQVMLTFSYFTIFLAVFFLAFGSFRGKRLSNRNPEYYIHDDDGQVLFGGGDDEEGAIRDPLLVEKQLLKKGHCYL